MRKKITILTLMALMVVSLSFAATKATSTTHHSTKSASTPKGTMKQEGTVQKIDAATHTIVLQIGSETKTFTFTDKTSWVKNGKKVKNLDLKVGDKVWIYSDSKNVAQRIVASPTNT
jgi:Cu/Ag efflux protein CusF